MKTGKIQYLLVIAAISSFMFSSCKKDNNATPSITGLTSAQTAQVQNSDVQDAVADKADQDVDKSMDDLQANNYQTSNLKSDLASGSRVITVNHPDSTTFPKLITIVYTNYQDSTADESFVKNGEIDITVTADGTNYQKISRAFTFKAFSITTDSTTIKINGIRTVARTVQEHKFTGLSSLRLSATDQITASTNWAIVKTGQTDTLKFTRIVARARKSIFYYDNVGGLTWKTVKFRNNLAKDTITFTGTVTGINEKGDNYTKTISEATPLTVNYYHNTPVITGGTMAITVTGTTAASYTVTFKEDLPNHPYMTLVTVTNNTTLKTHSFDRRFGRKFSKWWS